MTGTILNVSNATELLAAVKTLKGGETILMQPGEYGDLSLYGPKLKINPTSEVIFKSADPEHPAEFNTISITHISNITFDSVKVDITNHHARATTAVSVSNAKNIIIKNSELSGEATGENPYSNSGIAVRFAENVQLLNNEIHHVGWGTAVGESSNVTVSGNLYHDNLGDNSRYGSDIHNILVENNTFYPPHADNPLNTHQDQIQFWTTNATENSTNIVIRGNEIYNYGQTGVQSIFMRGNYLNSADGTWNEFRYKDVLIENNVIVGNHTHGIQLNAADGAIIRNNTVTYSGLEENPAEVSIPKITVSDSTNTEVYHNVANGITQSGNGVNSHDNVVIDRYHSTVDNYAGNMFVNADDKLNATADDLRPQEGSMLDLGNGQFIGALKPEVSTDGPVAMMKTDYALEAGNYKYTLDAAPSTGANGVDLVNAQYVWQLADGTKLYGEKVSLFFEEAGKHNVTLTVTDAQGRTDTFEHQVNVRDPHALQVNFDGTLENALNATSTVLGGSTNWVDTPWGGKAMVLDTQSIKIPASSDFYGSNSELTLSMSMKLDPALNSKPVQLLNDFYRFGLTLDSKGVVKLAGTEFSASFKPALVLRDGQWHDVAFTANSDHLTLYVDGQKVDQVAAPAKFIDMLETPGTHGYAVGGTAHLNYFKGAIDNLNLYGVALTDQQVATLHNNEAMSDLLLVKPAVMSENTVNIYQVSNNPTPVEPETPPIIIVPPEVPAPIVYNNITITTNTRDAVLGTDGHDRIDSGNQADTINAGAGDDILIGGHANDTLTGGAGRDTFLVHDVTHASQGARGEVITDFVRGEDKLDLTQMGYTSLVEAGKSTTVGQLEFKVTTEGVELYDRFSSFGMKLTGLTTLSANDILFGQGVSTTAGNDTVTFRETHAQSLVSEQGSFVLDMGAGNDIVNIWNYKADVVNGGAGDDIISTHFGNDTILGGAGNDIIHAGAHGDVVNGGDGNDRIDGGAHSDMLTGGSGSDMFVFNKGESTLKSADTITDFKSGEDKIDVHALGLENTFSFASISSISSIEPIGSLGSDVIVSNLPTSPDVLPVVNNMHGLIVTKQADGVLITHQTADFAVKLVGVGSVSANDFIF